MIDETRKLNLQNAQIVVELPYTRTLYYFYFYLGYVLH